MDRNENKTIHSPNGSGSRNGRTDREKTAVVEKKICHNHRQGALDFEEKARRYGPRINDRNKAREAKEPRRGGPLY